MVEPRFGLETTTYTPVGGGVEIKPLMRYVPGDEESTEVVGFVVAHTHVDGARCEGAIHIGGEQSPNWIVVQERPMTLTPSIHAPACGLHGHIVGGVWVPC